MIDQFRSLIEDAGGYVHPDLQLLVGDEAEHGLVSLAGVDSNELSLRVPTTLAERMVAKGPWLEFVESLGATIDAQYIGDRAFRAGVIPLVSAANHNDGENAGRLVEGADCLELHGVDFCYATPPKASNS